MQQLGAGQKTQKQAHGAIQRCRCGQARKRLLLARAVASEKTAPRPWQVSSFRPTFARPSCPSPGRQSRRPQPSRHYLRNYTTWYICMRAVGSNPPARRAANCRRRFRGAVDCIVMQLFNQLSLRSCCIATAIHTCALNECSLAALLQCKWCDMCPLCFAALIAIF